MGDWVPMTLGQMAALRRGEIPLRPSMARARTRRRRVRLSQARALSTRQKQIVRKMIDARNETNDKDTPISSGTDITSTVLITDLTNISQGDAVGERVGDVVRPQSLQYSIRLSNWGASSASDNIPHNIRMMLIRWNPDTANEDFTAINNVIIDGTDGVDSLITSDEVKRKKFNLIFDKQCVVRSVNSNSGDTYPVAKWYKGSVSLPKNKPVRYNEGLTTGSGKLYLVLVSSSSTANTTECKAYLRLRYKEN